MGHGEGLFSLRSPLEFSFQVAIKLLATFRKSYEVLYQSVLDRVRTSWVTGTMEFSWFIYGLSMVDLWLIMVNHG